MNTNGRLPNYINGEWRAAATQLYVNVLNPATAETLAEVPLCGGQDVDAAVQSAADAFPEWRHTPPEERIQYLFKLKTLLEENFEDLARLVTMENGKTLAESLGEVRRGIENVEVACGIPMLMHGYNLEDIARGIDETMIRQPVGVAAAITPFNFPMMVPFWFLPYAIACGNTFVLKPSERVPLAMQRAFELIDETGLPRGVASLVYGAKDAVDALLQHSLVRAISFVGSTPVARWVYAEGAAHGKRVQAQGGAKNHVVILPDADIAAASQMVSESAFGCAGQRCLAASVAVTVGDARHDFTAAVAEVAASMKVGYGLDQGVQMGPVITQESKTRVEGLIAKGLSEGADPLVDGRNAKIRGFEAGNFIEPTVLQDVAPESDLSRTEIFGPVLSLIHASTVDDAIRILSKSPYGNAASIFTTSESAPRQFRYEVPAGNIGVSVGVAAPVAYFPFSGWRDSFFADLHGQGKDAIEFYTEKKVVIERWRFA